MERLEKNRLHTAMMLLETAAEEGAEQFGTDSDYHCAAHSYIQYAITGEHSWDGAEPMVRAILEASGSDMTEEILAE